jgi:hypothetical protein
MSKQLIRLSSTALRTIGCAFEFDLTVIKGYKQPPSSKAVYGVALHKFIDTMYKTESDVSLSLAKAKNAFNILKEPAPPKQSYYDDFRHLTNTALTLWTEYIEKESTFDILVLDGKAATEITFDIPYYEDDHIIVRLQGTIDKIGQFKGGCFAVGDWKTTGQWDLTKFFSSFKVSAQLRIYHMVCLLMSQREPESTLGRIGATRMGTFIEAIQIKPDANDNVIKRSEVFQYSAKEIADFQLQIDDVCHKISRMVSTGYIPKEGIVNTHCTKPWGLCKFANVCANSETIGNLILKKDFIVKEFTPLNYDAMEE